MAAPDLARRTTVAVAKIGTDDPGANIVGAPQPRLTIARALLDLATTYDPATIDAVKVICLEPGVYVTPAFELPPNVFIEADPDAEGGSNGQVVISLTGNITLATAWQNNVDAVGGFRGVTITAEENGDINGILPTPGGAPTNRTLTFENVRIGGATSVTLEATGSLDFLQLRDVVMENSNGQFSVIGFNATIVGLQSACQIVLSDSLTNELSAQATGIFMSGGMPGNAQGVTIISQTNDVNVRLGNSTIQLLTLENDGAATLTVYADADSIPLAGNISYVGSATTANLIRTTDSGAIAGAVASVGGSFAMVGGIASVGNVAVLVSSGIVLTRRTVNGAATGTFLVTVNPGGGGFTVAGGAVTDNGTYNYKVLN